MNEELLDEEYETEDALEDDDYQEDAEEAAGDAQESNYSIPEEFVEIARKYKAGEPLTDPELDQIADTAIELLRTILKFFDAEKATIDEYDGGEGELILDISNADLALLIGRHGKTLESLQYIFTTLLNRKLGFRYPVMLDIEGYKNRRRQKLERIARSCAQKVLAHHSPVKLHPMRPYERRIIHLTLRNVAGVSTHSEGSEPNRYVVVTYNNGGSSKRQ